MPVSPFLRYTVLRYPSNRTLAQCSIHSDMPKWELSIYGNKRKNRQIISYFTSSRMENQNVGLMNKPKVSHATVNPAPKHSRLLKLHAKYDTVSQQSSSKWALWFHVIDHYFTMDLAKLCACRPLNVILSTCGLIYRVKILANVKTVGL